MIYKLNSIRVVRGHCTFQQHQRTLSVALQKLNSQHKSNPLRFSTVPRGYWKLKDNQRNHLDKIGRELGVKEMDDWYSVSREEVNRRVTFIKTYHKGSLFDALQKLYPQHKWDPL